MSKVTSKLQVTVPKAIADQYGIRPGGEIEWIAAGDSIRIAVHGKVQTGGQTITPQMRLRSFDQASARQRQRDSRTRECSATDRGWTREELYDRGRPR